ncbi:MAG TPA: T9SS type A sorting domain-containing protein, partial [Bacteroidia bacterium]|nr:T9SS type A sorting domain-containing protein [Bacteroidia bacterium]
DWARHMHIPVGTASDQAYSVLQTVDGGYLISGTTQNFGAGANDVFLMKTDSLGSILWSRTYGGSSNDYPHSLIVTADGGYAISGYSSSFTNGNDDIYIIKTNAIGDTLWTRIYGSANQESAKSIRQTSDGGYVVCGKSNSFSVYGAYVVKTNSNASMSCNEGNPATGMGYPSWNNNAASPIVASFGTSYPLSFTTSSGTMINNLCLTTSTDRDESNISFSLSPNPATTEIRIENKTKIESIEIYDVLGIRCQLLVVSGQSSVAQQLSTDTYPLTVDVSKLSPGIYFVKVKTEKGESAAKFVKQ